MLPPAVAAIVREVLDKGLRLPWRCLLRGCLPLRCRWLGWLRRGLLARSGVKRCLLFFVGLVRLDVLQSSSCG
ncbi:hypothetical protein M0802_011457 [Mischocyttarus mexicanus]|nr:hypothetical protein M0802_011457 [Mischocyttarus mexicanus]